MTDCFNEILHIINNDNLYIKRTIKQDNNTPNTIITLFLTDNTKHELRSEILRLQKETVGVSKIRSFFRAIGNILIGNIPGSICMPLFNQELLEKPIYATVSHKTEDNIAVLMSIDEPIMYYLESKIVFSIKENILYGQINMKKIKSLGLITENNDSGLQEIFIMKPIPLVKIASWVNINENELNEKTKVLHITFNLSLSIMTASK